jgi:hypothetical protein
MESIQNTGSTPGVSPPYPAESSFLKNAGEGIDTSPAAQGGLPQSAALSPTSGTLKTEFEDSTSISDTIPTQYRHKNQPQTTTKEIDSRHNTDTIPTQNAEIKLSSNAEEYRHNTDTNNKEKSSINSTLDNDNRHNTDTKLSKSHSSRAKAKRANPLPITDTIPTQTSKAQYLNTDTIPTQNSFKSSPDCSLESGNISTIDNRHNTDTKPTQYQHSTDTRDLGSRHKANTTPTQEKHNTDTIPTPHPTQYQHSFTANTDTIPTQLNSLRGLKLKAFEYCYLTYAQSGLPFRITYDALAINAGVAAGSVRTTAKRLKEDGLLLITHLGKGRGALIEISIPIDVEKAYSRRRITDTIPTQISRNNRHNTDTTPDTSAPSKLVSNYNNTNLLENADTPNGSPTYNPNWKVEDIDISSLSSFGITSKQLQDIRNQKLDVGLYELQSLIDRFTSYALTEGNLRGVRRPAGLFVSLVKMLAQGEDPLPGVESDETLFLQNIKSNQETEHARLDREARAAIEDNKRRVEEELSQRAKEHFSELSDSEKLEIVPEQAMAKIGSTAHNMLVMAKLKEQISVN